MKKKKKKTQTFLMISRIVSLYPYNVLAQPRLIESSSSILFDISVPLLLLFKCS